MLEYYRKTQTSNQGSIYDLLFVFSQRFTLRTEWALTNMYERRNTASGIDR